MKFKPNTIVVILAMALALPGTTSALPVPTDLDRDGLSNFDELTVYHTNPHNRDSDGDGLLDGTEVHQHGTDPLNTDTDGDGVWDDAEVRMGLDPLQIDLDADGVTDATDNCPWLNNPLQEDQDRDYLGDACDEHPSQQNRGEQSSIDWPGLDRATPNRTPRHPDNEAHLGGGDVEIGGGVVWFGSSSLSLHWS